MRDIYDQIHELEGIPKLTKHEQFVQGIINAVDNKVVAVGDLLPSVNKLMAELGFARETIMRGYKELIKRGIVESRNRMGFFIASADTGLNLRVALLLYAFDTFQETFYKTFKKHLDPAVHLDVFFHHNNIEILETIIGNIRGKYGMYVVAPIPNPRTKDILRNIPVNKFLMIDRFEQMDGDFSYVTQEFEESTYRAFCGLKEYAPHATDHNDFRLISTVGMVFLTAFPVITKDAASSAICLKSVEYVVIPPQMISFTMSSLWDRMPTSVPGSKPLPIQSFSIAHNSVLLMVK